MVDAEATRPAAGEGGYPRRHSQVRTIEAFMGRLIEIPAALLVVAEVVSLFAGVVARYIVQQPLIWSDELASILFLWLAMLGSVVAFRRAEHLRMTAVRAAAAPGLRPLGNLNVVIFFVGVVGVCVFAGVPIAFAFGLAIFGYLALTTRTPLMVLVGRMDEGMSHLILLAVPLFIFLGLLIEMAGMAR